MPRAVAGAVRSPRYQGRGRGGRAGVGGRQGGAKVGGNGGVSTASGAAVTGLCARPWANHRDPGERRRLRAAALSAALRRAEPHASSSPAGGFGLHADFLRTQIRLARHPKALSLGLRPSPLLHGSACRGKRAAVTAVATSLGCI